MPARSYPSRCKKIGEIHSLFLQCYKSGKIPFINIGPSHGPSLCMMVMAGFMLSFFLGETVSSKSDGWVKALMYTSIFLNLFCYLKTLLGNPGIEPSIFEHYRSFEFDELLADER